MSSKPKLKKIQNLRSDETIIADLEKRIEVETENLDKRLKQAKEHLVQQLDTASQKYRTVNGYMQAKSAIEESSFGSMAEGSDADARNLAREISDMSAWLSVKVTEVDVYELDETILDGYMNEDFISLDETPPPLVAQQLLVVNLLQNISPMIDGLMDFRESKTAEIAKMKEELEKQKAAEEGVKQESAE